jgi:hypothetical protein
MKNVKCTCPPIDWKGKYWERHECPGCERWWSLHSRLAQLLPGIRPWHWPVIQSPRVQGPYPEGSHAAAQWSPNETAQARWRELEAALAEGGANRKVPRITPDCTVEIDRRLESAINQSLAYTDYFPASPQDQQRRH